MKHRGGGHNAYRHRMRCRRCARDPDCCSGRFTLRRNPVKYKRPIKCPCCGETERLYDAEKERVDEMERKQMCFCFNLSSSWGHKKGEMLG